MLLQHHGYSQILPLLDCTAYSLPSLSVNFFADHVGLDSWHTLSQPPRVIASTKTVSLLRVMATCQPLRSIRALPEALPREGGLSHNATATSCRLRLCTELLHISGCLSPADTTSFSLRPQSFRCLLCALPRLLYSLVALRAHLAPVLCVSHNSESVARLAKLAVHTPAYCVVVHSSQRCRICLNHSILNYNLPERDGIIQRPVRLC